MSILEKLGFRKKVETDWNKEIDQLNLAIVELGKERERKFEQAHQRELKIGFKGASYRPPEMDEIEQIDKSTQGLRDKITFIQEKQRREGEKVSEPIQ